MDYCGISLFAGGNWFDYHSALIFSVLLLPFAGALLVRAVSGRKAVGTGVLILFLQLILSVGLAREVFTHNAVHAWVSSIMFRCDLVSLVFAFTSVTIGIFIYIFALGYFYGYSDAQKQKFSLWGLVFVGSMMGVVLSDNLISLFFFWELAGLCSWKLIGFYRKSDHLVKADKAFLITSAGAGFMMLGFAFIYLQTGTLSLVELSGFPVSQAVFILFFIGVVTKSATFPFHTWLPDASVAPTPVTAFLHAAVLVKIGIYGLLRVFGVALTVEGWILWAGWLALFSSFVAGIVALREEDIKKVLAFSTVSQLGFMIAGLVMFNMLAIRGILVFYMAHALGKGCLFLCAGIAERVFATKNIKDMGGLMKKMPALSFAFVISMLSVIGIPPLPGFFGKLDIILGMLSARHVFFAFFAILTSVLTLLYLFRVFKHVFMGESKKEAVIDKDRGLKPMITAVSVLGAVSLLLGMVFL